VNNFEQLGKELERRGKTEQIKQLAQTPEGQRFSKLVDADELERAARNGDAAAMKNIISKVLSTGEGKMLAESVRKMMEK